MFFISNFSIFICEKIYSEMMNFKLLLCIWRYAYVVWRPSMDRTTIMLPHDLKMLANMEASARGISLGELVRVALAEICDKKKSKDPFFNDNVVFDAAAPYDLSANVDDYLYDEK